MSDLDGHVTQPAETDHADLLALGDAPVAHGRVGRDPGAEERRGSREIEVRRNAQDEALVDDHAVGVTTVSDAPEMLVPRVVGEGSAGAELLEARLALGAGAVGIDQAADAGEIARPELRDRGADLRDTSDDLVAGDAWVDGGHHAAPLVPRRVEIGVADPAEQDLDLDVVRGRVAPLDRGGG